jgi:uncharacterized protein YbjT (DUF2867 family)
MDTETEVRRAVVAGATGLVGRALVGELIADDGCAEAVLLLRRPDATLPVHPKLRPLIVDFEALATTTKLAPATEAYCCLGTTIKVAGSKEAFRKVDLTYVVAFAQAAREAGARRFGVVSALGAARASSVFYNRVKGEMEAVIARMGFESVVIVRPSLLSGNRAALAQPARFGERLALGVLTPLAGLLPKRVRPIDVRVVARGLHRALVQAGREVRIIESAELQAIGAAAP